MGWRFTRTLTECSGSGRSPLICFFRLGWLEARSRQVGGWLSDSGDLLAEFYLYDSCTRVQASKQSCLRLEALSTSFVGGRHLATSRLFRVLNYTVRFGSPCATKADGGSAQRAGVASTLGLMLPPPALTAPELDGSPRARSHTILRFGLRPRGRKQKTPAPRRY